MKTKLTLLIILLAVVFVYEEGKAQAPNWSWAKSAGETSHEYGYGISTDASGDVLVTGYFDSPSITFGTTTLTNVSAGSQDIFIVKYDASGNVIWAKSAGGAPNDFGIGIATDANGNVLVTGYFNSDSITFGTTILINAGNTTTNDIFIVKYDASGNFLWAKSAGGISYEAGYGIATDASGNVLVTGIFDSDSITFGTTTLTNSGGDDIFIAKYDASGNVVWVTSAGGTNSDYGTGISADVSGNVLLTGYFRSDSITFGTTTLTNAGNFGTDVFIVKYDASGNVFWAKSAGGINNDYGAGISTDASGNALVTGSFQSDSITFGTITLTNLGTFFPDIFIIKYDALGNALWATSAGGTNSNYGTGISTDANGNILVTGSFLSDTIIFGTTTLTNLGTFSPDIYIAKYDASGNSLWAKSAGGIDNDYGTGISTDASGNVLVTGYFNSPSIAFGTTTLTNTGSTDIFVAKLDNTTGIIPLSEVNYPFTIYPNPSTGQITITSSKIIDEVTITNPLGQVVYQAKASDKNLSLQIKDDGIYFVTITSDKKTATGKVIVQH